MGDADEVLDAMTRMGFNGVLWRYFLEWINSTPSFLYEYASRISWGANTSKPYQLSDINPVNMLRVQFSARPKSPREVNCAI